MPPIATAFRRRPHDYLDGYGPYRQLAVSALMITPSDALARVRIAATAQGGQTPSFAVLRTWSGGACEGTAAVHRTHHLHDAVQAANREVGRLLSQGSLHAEPIRLFSHCDIDRRCAPALSPAEPVRLHAVPARAAA
jgi:hypothetical protein